MINKHPACGNLSREFALGDRLAESRLFPELVFIRLSDGWQEIKSEDLLLGCPTFEPRILRQFQLKWAPQVMLDFWYRGAPVSATAAQTFGRLLQKCQQLLVSDLQALAEVLGTLWDTGHQPVNHIHCAEIRELNGRKVLLVGWSNDRVKRHYLSVFVDALGDGSVVREIHFSAPDACFAENVNAALECWSSIQWQANILPPLSSIA